MLDVTATEFIPGVEPKHFLRRKFPFYKVLAVGAKDDCE